MKAAAWACLLLILTFLAPSFAQEGGDQRIPRAALVEDVRQLADIIETSHPDPYSHGGGRIRFHYRLHALLNAIPADGMTKDDFIRLLRPFVAAVGDQHTSIYTDYAVDNAAPGGLPFVFGVVEKDLFVQIPFVESDLEYYGSMLLSVEGVTVRELVDRFKRLEACENDYFALREFARGRLLFEPYLHELVPEWVDRSKVEFQLRRPSGAIETVTRKLPIGLSGPLSFADSAVELPKTDDSGFLWDFIDPLEQGTKIAYLRVDHMQEYREAKEMALAGGTGSYSTEELQATPSATESFRGLVSEMKASNTQTLVIDIRNNGGGNYMMAPILVYFLYGRDVLSSVSKAPARSGGGHGDRYSPLYLETRGNVTIESINEGRAVPLREGDINFSTIFADLENDSEVNPERIKGYMKAATFFAEYRKGEFSGFYCPPNVVVLMTPWTSSSGLDMALYLYRSGATLVGTPSAQAPNSWGNLLEWQLDHSGIKGEVASAFDIAFGDDPEKGRVLPLHHPLTYETLASYDFDRNAEFLYAMEVLKEKKRTDRGEEGD